MNVGSLFSGIGGIELGLERAGLETAWFIEKNRYCRAVLRKHWPSTTIYDDITQVDFRSLPRVDVLSGGFPCQDISNAGPRTGIKGSRSSLWKNYLKAIIALRPKYAIIENVSALTQRGLDTVLCDLAAIGYDAEWHCIPAAAIGAPHKRDRIFILAYPNIERPQKQQPKEEPRVDEIRPYRISVRQDWGTSYPSETFIRRGVPGIPRRVDRIRSLGNAVVPQVAQAIGEAIMVYERSLR